MPVPTLQAEEFCSEMYFNSLQETEHSKEAQNNYKLQLRYSTHIQQARFLNSVTQKPFLSVETFSGQDSKWSPVYEFQRI